MFDTLVIILLWMMPSTLALVACSIMYWRLDETRKICEQLVSESYETEQSMKALSLLLRDVAGVTNGPVKKPVKKAANTKANAPAKRTNRRAIKPAIKPAIKRGVSTPNKPPIKRKKSAPKKAAKS